MRELATANFQDYLVMTASITLRRAFYIIAHDGGKVKQNFIVAKKDEKQIEIYAEKHGNARRGYMFDRFFV